ncbi:trans-resveratrol di-O-methyltransferase-like [Rhododendron vialii]|uniref:trans-resveratrol di-O-methyltransferase-like n=1 Tax=Rhododendron vialii TaxID=182163 RepID=UPI00265FACA5|nr:trans-resveratrol di-O-methyltransferase-like [Rhododendron vialii]
MCLNCAVQLGIPDIIHNHKQPITLPELVSSLHLPPEKNNSIHRLLRLLVHLGFFATTKPNTNEGDQEGCVLTPSSRLLLKSEITNLSPLVRAMVDPVLVTPWQFLGDWFLGNETIAFETAHEVGMWEFCDQNPKFNHAFNEAMASDSKIMNFCCWRV